MGNKVEGQSVGTGGHGCSVRLYIVATIYSPAKRSCRFSRSISAPTPPERPVAGTEGHHLRLRDNNIADPNARKSWVWVPALSDNSSTSTTVDNRGGRHSRSRSSSQPPQERRPRSAEPPVQRVPPRSRYALPFPQPCTFVGETETYLLSSNVEFISASSNLKVRPDGRSYTRQPSQEYKPTQTGENAPYPPVSDGTLHWQQQQIPRFASTDGYRRKRTLSASRSFQQPNTQSSSSQQQHYKPSQGGSSSNARANANGVQRSQTLPVELIHQPPTAGSLHARAAVCGSRTPEQRRSN